MNQCRKMLEEDMGLPEKSLKGEKEYVKELIDKVVCLRCCAFECYIASYSLAFTACGSVLQVFTSNAAAEEPAAPSEGGEDDEAAHASEKGSPKQMKVRRKVSKEDEFSRKKLKHKEAKKKVQRKEEERLAAAPAGDTHHLHIDI